MCQSWLRHCLGWYGLLLVLYKTKFNWVVLVTSEIFSSNHFLMISSTAHILEYKRTNLIF